MSSVGNGFAQFDAWLQTRGDLRSRRTSRAWVMGILNVTPDSFSDGGRHLDPEAALDAAERMRAEGADVIDLGAESTRPGSQPVPAEAQWARLGPVLELMGRRGFALPLTVDTTRAWVAERAIGLGVAGVNDVSAGLDDPAMLPLVARAGCVYVLMHMQGTPATMQVAPMYDDVVTDVTAFLRERLDAAMRAGVARHRLVADPGIGFGKTDGHNLSLLKYLAAIRADLGGTPILVGTSRKGFLGRVAADDPGRPLPAEERTIASAATVAWAVANGADLLRVHDVGASVQTARVARAIVTAE